MNIRLATIGDFVESVANWNPARKPHEQFTYIDLSSVSQAEKRIAAANSVTGADAPSRARQIVKTGDILVSTVRPNLNGVAPVTEEFDGATASTGFCVLRPRPHKLCSSYLMHWVRSPDFIESMVGQATGASYPAVTDRIVKSSLIPLPPLDEQRRIAAILDKADALRHKRKKALRLFSDLSQALFLYKFGDEKRSPFEIKTLESVSEQITDGAHFTPTYVEEGIPFLRVTDIQDRTINWGSVKYIPHDEHAKLIQRCRPEIGDVLLSKNGTIGIPRYIDWSEEFSIFVSLCLIKPSIGILSGRFLAGYLKTQSAQRQLRQHSKTGTVTNLHLVEIRKMKIPVPPFEVQQEWDRFERQLECRHIEHLGADLATEYLFSSLQHRAFSGQL